MKMQPAQILRSKGKTFDLVHDVERIPLWDLRRMFFTSTNFVKLIGAHPFSDKKTLFRAKTGTQIPKTNVDKERGKALERVALERLQQRLGMDVFHLDGHFRSRRFHDFLASPDGITADGRLVEVKCPRSRAFWIPCHHEAQMRFDMWILDVEESIYVQLVDDAIFVDILQRNDRMVLDNLQQSLDFIAYVKGVNRV